MRETKRGDILEAIDEARSAILKASHNHEQATKALVKLGFEAVLEELKQLAEAIKPKPQPASWDVIKVLDLNTGLKIEGRIDTMQFSDSQETILTFGRPVDKKGFPAAIQGDPVFAASDDAVTLTPVDGDAYSIKVSGAHPSALGDDGVTPVAGTVTISGDADLGDGVATITGSEPYIVTSGSATGFGAAISTPPTEQA